MSFKEKWETLKNLLGLDTKSKLIWAFIFAGFFIPGIILWLLLPIQNYIDTKKKMYTFIAIIFIALGITLPNETNKIETGYTRVYTTVENKENGKKIGYAMFSPIQVVKNDNSDLWNVYKDGVKIGQVQKTSIVFEGTPEYEQAKQEKAEYDKKVAEAAKKLEAELKAERQKQLAELEKNINSVFYKVDLKKFSDDGNGIYDFYINPLIWVQLPFDQKENIFKNCATYVQLKTNGTEPGYAKYGTKIKSSSNGAILAEYSGLKGIQVK